MKHYNRQPFLVFVLAFCGAFLAHPQAEGAALTWVHSFAATDPNTNIAPEGYGPVVGLTQGTDGNYYGLTHGGANNTSVLYRVTPAGAVSVIYTPPSDFSMLLDASTPLLAVENAPDGKMVFYHAGGGGSDGNLIRITTDGTAGGTSATNIYQFDFNSSGISIRGGLLYDGGDGQGHQVLYGAAYGGGTRNRGTLFRIVTDGTANGTTATVLHNFGSDIDPQDGLPWTTLVKGIDGNLYGTTTDTANPFFGETQVDNGKVFQFSPGSGAYNVLYTFPLNGPTTPSSLVESSPGVFFGTARSPSGPGIIFKITVSGVTGSYATVYTFSSAGGVPVEYMPLLLDADGLMYGVLPLGGGVNHSGEIFSLTPDGSVTDLHDFSNGQTSADGSDPNCVLAIDEDGNLYGTATSGGAFGNGTVYRLNAPPKPPLPPFTSFNVQPPANLGGPVQFTASIVAGVKVTVQFSTNPSDSRSWMNLLDGGVMADQPAGSGNYVLSSAAYPTGSVSFRAVATKPGSQRSISDTKGPFTLHANPGFSPTAFTVNESTTPQTGLADSALRFAATQSGRPANLMAHVEASTDGMTWTPLTDNNGGQMGFDPTVSKFVLNSTSYPSGGGIYFRAVSTGGGFDPSFSNVVGPFVLFSTVPHVVPPVMYFTANGHVADFDFKAKYNTAQTGVTLRVQVSNTPANEASWVAFDTAGFGTMTQTSDPTLYRYSLNRSPYPDGGNIFFRVLAQNNDATAAAFGRSMPCGPFTITAAMPPHVTVHPPSATGGTGTQADPFILSGDRLAFSADAIVAAGRTLAALALEIDGSVITQTAPASGAANVPMPGLGDHVLRAIAADDLGAVARAAGAIFVRVISSPASNHSTHGSKGSGANASTTTGKVFTAVADGNWADPSTWRDQQGQPGVPYLEDMAIIGAHTVTITPSTTVFAQALTLRGGHLVGNVSDTGYNEGTASQLKVSGAFTISSATLEGWMHIESNGLLELQNADDIQFIPGASGLVALFENKGGCNVHGAAGIVGAHNFFNESPLTFLPPLQASAALPTNPALGSRLVQAVTGGGSISSQEAAKTGIDGSTLVSIRVAGILGENGSGLLNRGNVISNDGGTLISQDGNSLIGQDGNGLIGQDGNGIVGQGGGNIVGQGGGNINPASSNSSGPAGVGEPVTPITITGGEVNLDGVTLLGSVILNGGVLTGNGIIYGDLTNNGGYISPGHSAGHLIVAGNFTQEAGGTLILETGGFLPSQYDVLQVAGNATLGGRLDLKVINGYEPSTSDTFAPLIFGSASGSFASISSNAQITVTSNGVLVSADPTLPNPPDPATSFSALSP
ncbi:MAG: choice-of-anchor tandem repeat GloVer-containing protein, partial [Chthoniobacterales bacterium]